MGISRPEYWSGFPCPLPGDLTDPETELMPLTSPTLAGGFFTTSINWETPKIRVNKSNSIFVKNKNFNLGTSLEIQGLRPPSNARFNSW